MLRTQHHVIEEFIKLYEKQPCLWQVKSKDYYKKHLKEAAYRKLVEKLREIEPDSDKNAVIKKINNLRSSIRKEMKKRKLSIKSGATGDDIYKPKLWYFDLFNFLEENNSSNVDNNSDDEIELTEDWDEYSLQETPSKNSSSIPPNPVSRTQSECEAPLSSDGPTANRLRSLLTTNDKAANEAYLVSDKVQKDSSSQVEDRYDLLGKSIACRIRTLNKRQRLIVEKNINDILFEAEMEDLDAPTHQYNFDCTINS
ncbi:uncharacterized protein LOC111047499 [Nilaparvata lugens]|uniref:uncharacterized protein LOC111047499 n=1 Tax=Nilaparvata lugens TaxID=108931 RepID=UPI00193D0E21|nr:uncharacterized protein LOC111047499 [Nilaparvata lugens]